MTREEADFIAAMNMCDEISNEAHKKIMCHCEVPCEDAISRKWVLDVVNNFVFDTETDRNRIIHIVRDTAPLVMPKEKQEPILDKIRAEIEKIARPNEIGGRGYKESIRYGLSIALEIIDKYREGEKTDAGSN